MNDTAIDVRLGSILLGSTDAERLRDWYRQVLVPDHTGDGPFDLGAVRLMIEGRDDLDPTNPQPGRLLLNLYVDDALAFERHLADQPIEWVAPVTEREFGWVGTFCDADGNYLQVAQLKAKP